VILILITACFLAVFIVVPLCVVFGYALADGIAMFIKAITHPDTLSAIYLTVTAALIAVVANTVFGIAVAWLVVHFRFAGRGLILSLLDAPLALSPVVIGLMFVLLFGSESILGEILGRWGIKIIFATPGILLCTMFVTVPFVARELIPVMEERGRGEEEAAITMGASGWQVLRYVTIPSLKWAILYGVVLCNARAMGEFGAVSVVSGHIRGETNTLPLHIEILYNEYDFVGAFSASSLLALLAVGTLLIKYVLEQRQGGSEG